MYKHVCRLRHACFEKKHFSIFDKLFSIYRDNIWKRASLGKNIGMIGNSQKERDFVGIIGNIGPVEGLQFPQNHV
jgi:hypothetical protein